MILTRTRTHLVILTIGYFVMNTYGQELEHSLTKLHTEEKSGDFLQNKSKQIGANPLNYYDHPNAHLRKIPEGSLKIQEHGYKTSPGSIRRILQADVQSTLKSERLSLLSNVPDSLLSHFDRSSNSINNYPHGSASPATTYNYISATTPFTIIKNSDILKFKRPKKSASVTLAPLLLTSSKSIVEILSTRMLPVELTNNNASPNIKETSADPLPLQPKRENRKLGLLKPNKRRSTSQFPDRDKRYNNNDDNKPANLNEDPNTNIHQNSIVNNTEIQTEEMPTTINRRRLIKGKKRVKPFVRGPIIRMSEMLNHQTNDEEPIRRISNINIETQQTQNIEDIAEDIDTHTTSDFKRLKSLKRKKPSQSTLKAQVPFASYNSKPSLISLSKIKSSVTNSSKPASHQSSKNLKSSDFSNKPTSSLPDILNENEPLRDISNIQMISGTSVRPKPSSQYLPNTPTSLLRGPNRQKFPSSDLSERPKPSIKPFVSNPQHIFSTRRPSLLKPLDKPKDFLQNFPKSPKMSKENDDTGIAPTFEFPFVSSIVSGLPFFIDGHQHLGPFKVINLNF